MEHTINVKTYARRHQLVWDNSWEEVGDSLEVTSRDFYAVPLRGETHAISFYDVVEVTVKLDDGTVLEMSSKYFNVSAKAFVKGELHPVEKLHEVYPGMPTLIENVRRRGTHQVVLLGGTSYVPFRPDKGDYYLTPLPA